MMTFGRRDALGLGLGGVAMAATSTARGAEDPALLLRAVVTLNGRDYEFRQENGVDLGDFVSDIGGFTQRCIRVDIAGFPLSVFFRPDRTSDRVETVFELGRMWGATPAHLGAYSVAIWRGPKLLATLNVPAHYWYSRWRWQSAPRPVVGDVAKMIQQGMLPPYNRANAASAPPPSTKLVPPLHPYQIPNSDWIDLDVLAQFKNGDYSHGSSLVITSLMQAIAAGAAAVGSTTTPPAATQGGSSAVYTIMGLAGVTAYMPMTGERPDIGLITEPQAQYVCTSAQSALDTLRAQGEAGGTMPWHMRDERTGAPLSFITYPTASWYGGRVAGNPYIKTIDAPVSLDSAHMPGIVYLPYMLTGDPYHLEDLQFQANWNWGWYNPDYRPSIVQARQFAWNIRTLAQVTKVTPAKVPAWLLPQSHWAAQLNTWQQFFMATYVNGQRADLAVFRTCTPVDGTPDQGPTSPGGTWASMWEDEFVAAVLGWVVAMGFSEWRSAFDWKIGSTIARAGGTSGWIRAYATPYRAILRATPKSPFTTTWAAAWQLTQSVTRAVVTDPNTWYDNDMTYLTYTRGALVYAVARGTPGATAALDWATQQIKAKKWTTDNKWRLGTGI